MAIQVLQVKPELRPPGFGPIEKAARKSSGRISGSLSKAGNAVAGVTKAATLAGAAAVAGIGVGAVKGAADFSKGMREVNTLLGLGEKEFGNLNDDVKDFISETGAAAGDVVPALYQAISAGVPRENVFDFLRTANKAAVGGVTDLETSVDAISTVVNAYGAENVNATQAADILFQSVRNGKTTMEELGASLATVIPTASAFGINFGEVAAAFTTVTTQGVPTSEAMTQVRSLLQSLGAPTTEASKLFGELGIEVNATRLANEGVVPVLQEVIAATGGNEAVLRKMLGSTEAMNAALILTSDSGLSTFENALADNQNAAGATDAAFNQMRKDVGVLFGEFKNRLNVILITLGEQILPSLVGALNVFSQWFTENRGRIEEAIVAMTEVAGEFIAHFKSGIEGLMPVVRGLFEFIRTNRVGMVAAIAAIGAAILIAFGPVSLAVAAIVGAIALFGKYRNNLEQLRVDVLRILQGIAAGFVKWGITLAGVILQIPLVLEELRLQFIRLGLRAAEGLGEAILGALKNIEIPIKINFDPPGPGSISIDKTIRPFSGVPTDLDFSGLEGALTAAGGLSANLRGQISEFTTNLGAELGAKVAAQFDQPIAEAEAALNRVNRRRELDAFLDANRQRIAEREAAGDPTLAAFRRGQQARDQGAAFAEQQGAAFAAGPQRVELSLSLEPAELANVVTSQVRGQNIQLREAGGTI